MEELTKSLETAFTRAADPVDAAKMKAYLKGQFDFYGIKAPVRKEILKESLSEWGKPTTTSAPEMADSYWMRKEREWQYCAMELLQRMKYFREEDSIDLFEKLVCTKSWWDTVDFIASNLVGEYLLLKPDMQRPKAEEWLNSGNMWLQRTALLFQLKYRLKTDTDLLIELINELRTEQEFFIRKAIGWSLRQYGKYNPEWVIHQVDKLELTGLSRREALKNLKKQGEYSR